jgi:hypothetical protein
MAGVTAMTMSAANSAIAPSTHGLLSRLLALFAVAPPAALVPP